MLGCSSCSATNISQCFNCADGFYNNTDGECVACPNGCSFCESASNCTACDFGFKFKNFQCLLSCNHPCFDCLDNQPNACTKCFGGYSLVAENNTCQEDTSCNNQGNCLACPRRFSLFNRRCSGCNVDSSCAQCSRFNTSVCTKCKVGFYFLDGACTECLSDCVDCFSNEYCYECKGGYFMPLVLGIPTGRC